MSVGGVGGTLSSTVFLNVKGRVVTDALLWKADEDTIVVDCCESTAPLLLSHLQKHVLRKSNVKVADSTEDLHLTVAYGLPSDVTKPPADDDMLAADNDPRGPYLGFRILTRSPFTKLNEKLFPKQEGTAQILRRLSGLPTGDEVASLTCLEANADLLHSVAFDKGCYLGQELTARSYFKGVVRKRCVPVVLWDTDKPVPVDYVCKGHGDGDGDGDGDANTDANDRDCAVPKLSVLQAGAMLWVAGDESTESSTESSTDAAADASTHVAIKQNSKLIDTKTNKSVGEVLTTPLPGHNLAVCQLRLDFITKDYTTDNIVEIELENGDKKLYKLLPFIPSWWPKMDWKSGKATKEKYADEVVYVDEFDLEKH
jgi:folate-binding protein YgfZ